MFEAPEAWPQSKITLLTLNPEDPEVKNQDAVAFSTQTHPGSDLVEKLIGSYSHWISLVRTVACFKLLVWSHKKDAPTPRVDAQQLQQAKDSLIAHVQMHHYPDELSALREGKEVSPSSPLRKLGPSLVDGLIVATGRLKNAELPSWVNQTPRYPARTPHSREDRPVYA